MVVFLAISVTKMAIMTLSFQNNSACQCCFEKIVIRYAWNRFK